MLHISPLFFYLYFRLTEAPDKKEEEEEEEEETFICQWHTIRCSSAQ